MAPPTNTAAWLASKSAKAVTIGPAPYTPPRAGEMVVRNEAVAINPVDWAKQLLGNLLLGHVRYPHVAGGDLAGTVVEVGPQPAPAPAPAPAHSNTTDNGPPPPSFRVGDRVLGLGAGFAPAARGAAEGAFQEYTVVRTHLAARIPGWMAPEQACVLPLCLTTAAYGLFHADFLALDLPRVPPIVTTGKDKKKKVVIVTGGASSVGCNAVQLATAAGYDVYSTASPRNHELVRGLGAAKVFDYKSRGWVGEMGAALEGREVVGALTVGDGAAEACITILKQCPGARKFIAFAGLPLPAERLKSVTGMAGYAVGTMWGIGKMALQARAAGVQVKFIDTKDLCEPENVVGRVFGEYVPAALEARQLVVAPEPLVVGKGLEKIQEAMDVQAKGVSARKVVVVL